MSEKKKKDLPENEPVPVSVTVPVPVLITFPVPEMALGRDFSAVCANSRVPLLTTAPVPSVPSPERMNFPSVIVVPPV